MGPLAWVLLGIAGGWGLCAVTVIGLMPRWIRGAADGDLAELGILDTAVGVRL